MDGRDFEELTRSVLARTSGSSCPSAHERLAPLADGDLEAGDAELIRLHVAHCGECARILDVVAWLAKELPALAEVEPGPAFTRDVMAATAGRRSFAGVVQDWMDRARDAARALAVRPRLPLEGAYIGAMVVWLLVAAPFSPLRGVPEQAAELARINPAAVAQAAVVPLPEFLSNPADAARAFWSSTATRLPGDGAPGEITWSVRLDRAADRARSLGFNGLRMTGETLRLNFSRSREHFRLMGDDAKAVWRILRGPRSSKEPSRPSPNTTAPRSTIEKEA